MTGAAQPIRNPASFRDPAGHVFHWSSRVFRVVAADAVADFEAVAASGLLGDMEDRGELWPGRRLDPGEIPPELREMVEPDGVVIEHPPLPAISYPYEWPFALLKKAALLHLDLHRAALERGCTIIDGSAYNIQFVGTKPVFIDTLSLRPYRDGEYWLGYRQFCEQFLNPLLLTARVGIPYHDWYRGALEGIRVEDAARLMPFWRRLDWTVLVHVILHARMIRKAQADDAGASARLARGMSRRGFDGLLSSLRSAITRLRPRHAEDTTWGNYEHEHSYGSGELNAKRLFVADFAAASKPRVLWDMGCNTGVFSEAALDAGAGSAIGFDFDPGALEAAVRRADDRKLNFLPLFLDATNPSPDQGWGQAERVGLAARARADAVIALALFHHLVIAKNLPPQDALDWLIGLAPEGVIEFVPRTDPMVVRMLASRYDVIDYIDLENFTALIERCARVVRSETVSQSGRVLFHFSRTNQ